MRSKPLDLRSVIGSLSRSNAKHPSPARVQPESNLTEVIRRNRSKNKCRHVRERCPSIPRFVRHEFLMAVMPHDRQPRVAVATTPKEVASSGFVHEKDSTNPGMAAALRTCPVTPCPVQSDRVRAQSNRASCIVNPDKNAVSRHNDQAALPRMTITTVGRCYKRKPIKKRPCKLSDNSLHGLFLLKQTKRGLVVNLMGPHGLKPIESAINPIRTLRQGTSQEGA